MKLLRILSCAFAAALWLGATGTAVAAPFDIDCGSATDVDTDPATVVTCNVAQAGTITDLNILLNIDDTVGNPYATDLDITLIHVATGTSVDVYLGTGVNAPQSIMDATFDDEAAATVPGSGNIIGTFFSAQLLSAFDGLELSGQWDLRITDTTQWTDEGIDLMEWRLEGVVVPEPGLALLLGFVAVALARPPRLPAAVA